MQGKGQHRLPVEQAAISRLTAKKKSERAAEQDRPDVAAAREEWHASQPDLNPERLVFIDETGAATDMARRYGRCPRGQRLISAVPWGHWKTTTFVAALRVGQIAAPCVFDGPDGWAELSRLCRAVRGPDPAARRYRRHGQSPQPQGRRHSRSHRSRRRRAALPARLQPRLQPHRTVLRQTQSPAAKGR